VIPGTREVGRERDLLPAPVPEPDRVDRSGEATVRMVGIGGTGVVTVSQILAVAALLDGRHVWGLDQTGLSQKGGPVISDIRVSESPILGSNRVGVGGADVFLGFDLLGAATPQSAVTIREDETVAVVSTSAVPTGQMVVDDSVGFPSPETVAAAVGERAAASSRFFDAQAISLELFDDHMPSNLIVLGAAYQLGALPVGSAALHEAIRLNGGKSEINLAAFEWGRVAVARPQEVEALIAAEEEDEPEVGEDLDSMVAWLARDLADYQDERYAADFRAFVDTVRRREEEVCPGAEEVTRGAARALHKLMAYKDEYEVARLHLDPAERDRIARTFGPDARVSWNLHPPILRALGMDRKIEFGPWFEHGFKALRSARRLRGTKVDPFGRAKVRRVERELIGRYKDDLGSALDLLTERNHEAVAELAGLPQMVRGYEEIKLRNVVAYEGSMEASLARLRAAGPASLVVVGR
jgi:indolepyruvate ferredoxin oxidoreductase